jgi:Flp pilus assembly protein TadD
MQTWIYFGRNEKKRLTETVHKLINVYQALKQWEPLEQTWRLLLPTSEIYSKLEEPTPEGQVWRNIIEFLEEKEKQQFEYEVKENKMKLGAPPLAKIQELVEERIAQSTPLIDIYPRLLNLGEDKDIIEKYILLLHKRVRVESDPKEKSKYWALLQHHIHHTLESKLPIQCAYQYHLDNLDVKSVQDYPKALLSFYLSTWGANTTDSYASAARWIMEQLEPEELDPQSLFSCMVFSQLDPTDEIAIEFTSRGLNYIALANTQLGIEITNISNCFLLKRARAYVNLGLAYDAFRDLNKLSTSSSELALCKGEAWLILGEIVNAKVEFEKIKESPWPRSCLGWINYLEKRNDVALQLLTSVGELELKATNHIAWHQYRLGRAYFSTGNLEQAFGCLLKAAQLAPTMCTEAFTYLGFIYSKRKDMDRAAKCWLKAYNLNNSDLDAADHLTRFYVSQSADTRSKAKTILMALSEKSIRISWIWHRLGIIQMKENDFASASYSFQSACRIDPKNPQLWQLLGECYLSLGRNVAALKGESFL